MSGTHRYIILALTLLFTIASHARITFLRDSLEQSLKEETHTANKISTLYNLYDLSLDHEDRMDALNRLYPCCRIIKPGRGAARCNVAHGIRTA